MNAIEAKGLNKIFTKNLTRKVRALDDVSLSVPGGSVFGFIGPNGAGKSTTIKILMGLLTPTSGTSRLFGLESSEPRSRLRVGYLAENPAYYEYLTPRELLRFVAGTYGVESGLLTQRVEETLAAIGLVEAADRRIRSLSKGMVQRLGLGQTLVHDPDLYILDEPMSGLDPLGRRLVADIILSLKERGKTIFFSTHIIHDVERICDEVAILLGGQVRFTGSIKGVVDESFTRYEIVVRNSDTGIPFMSEDTDNHISHEGYNLKLSVPKEELAQRLAALSKHSEILSVEPERKSLEQIFLELVKHG
jgi:ABC-2 type transport system ATP-binding protein